MSTKVEIYNLALAHIGVTFHVEDPDETSLQAGQITLVYDVARKKVMEDVWWKFCKRYKTLTQVEDFSQQTGDHDWLYSYRYPQNCLTLRRIVTINGPNESNPPTWDIGQDDSGLLVFTNWEAPNFEYTYDTSVTTLFPHSFAMALSLYIATLIAPSLSQMKDAVKVNEDRYQVALLTARANDANQDQPPENRDAEWIEDR